MGQFEEKDKVDGSLILWRHKSIDKHHFIIQIQPALEKWIINICQTELIELNGLPIDLARLKKYTKKQSSLENTSLKDLFTKMSEKDENISIRKLKAWIKILKEKNYSVDINELINA